MQNLSWKESVIKVLEKNREAMHYTDIANEIDKEKLRKVGATPAISVNTAITLSIKNEKSDSPFIKVDKGRFWLKSLATNSNSNQQIDQPEKDDLEETGLINAFGMYWSRDKVSWISKPKILGIQSSASDNVDFSEQKGVYLLHDGHIVIYVGRTTDQPLGVRLKQHTFDRLSGRWDRFSWFGVYPVTPQGKLKSDGNVSFDLEGLIVTMEALLIEGLEPPQNRKGGDGFRAVEFLQSEDTKSQKTNKLNDLIKTIEELKKSTNTE